MKIKKSLPITPINYLSEGQLLYVLLPSKAGVQFATFDPNTFEGLSAFTIHEKLGHNQALIHDERLFLITTDGIIGYDTFTGQQAVFMQTSSVPLSMGILGDKLVSLCGIPLLRNRKINTDDFCICVNDIKTGEKLSQSQTIHESSHPALADGIWFASDGFIHRLSEDCELIGRRRLIARPDAPLLDTNDYVVSVSDLGTLEIFYKETMKRHANILVNKNNSLPLAYDNTLLWFTETVLRQIDLDSGSVSTICEIQNPVVSSLAKSGNDIYSADDKGNLVKVSIGPPVSVEVLRLSEKQAWKPVLSGEYLYIASPEALHQIEVKS